VDDGLDTFEQAAFPPAEHPQWALQREGPQERFPVMLPWPVRPLKGKVPGQTAGVGLVHARRDDRVGDVMNVSSAPVDSIPADVPLAFFK
jgi:hypothetical protein